MEQVLDATEAAGHLNDFSQLEEFSLEELVLMSFPAEKEPILKSFERIRRTPSISEISEQIGASLESARAGGGLGEVGDLNTTGAFYELATTKVIPVSLP